VNVGDPIAAVGLIGTMGNTGADSKNPEKGKQHVHYQLRDPTGTIINPMAFWDQQGPVDPRPPPPAYLEEYQQYLHDIGTDAAGVPSVLSPAGNPASFDERLPQPRSKIALAAETRAAAVASLLRITPTRTLSAVLVWLRASERISVSVLRIQTRSVIPVVLKLRRAIAMICGIPALTNIPPTPQSRSGRPARAISDARSSRLLLLLN
jgi:hypothetical protein